MVGRESGSRPDDPQGDLGLMQRALFHAARGQGRTTPNPMVGAVVRDAKGVVVGHGWHTRAGEPHAEVNALAAAGDAARGGTLYVTLEPCDHTGRTGPCTAQIVRAGIRRVVAAMQDPDERVRGRGFDALRAHGISVEVGLCRQEAERLNAPFVSVKIRQRPFVILKAATSIDGRISIVGQRTTLSSLAANRKTQQLRAAVDAIMIGSETALVDDPVLTVRDSQRVRPLVRVIIDRRLRLTAHARLFSTVGDGPVIILTSPTTLATAPAAVAALEAAGATVTAVDDLPQALGTLLDWDVSSVLVEGGARLQASFWSANLVDRLHLIVAPTALGESAVPLFAGRPIPRSMLTLTNVEARGADTWIEADVHRHH